jgi:hypothetical protein
MIAYGESECINPRLADETLNSICDIVHMYVNYVVYFVYSLGLAKLYTLIATS